MGARSHIHRGSGRGRQCVMDCTGHCQVFNFYSEMGHPGGFGAEEYECIS